MRRSYGEDDWKYEFRKYLERRGVTPTGNRSPSLMALLCAVVLQIIKDIEEMRQR